MGLTVAEGRKRRGEGPARVKALGGVGREPLYETGGGDWWVHAGLCGVARLRLLTWLCMRGGEHTAPALAAALGLSNAADALMGMRWWGLVACRPMPLPPREKPRPEAIYKWLWRATDEGRKYLWRYGWVTGRLVPGVWYDATFLGGTDVCPCAALAADAAPSLLRPTQLAAAWVLWMLGPLTARRMAQLVGVSRGAAQLYLRTWARLGWAERTEPEGDDSYWRTHPECHRAWHWRVTRPGLLAMERHAHALGWAAQHSGYEVPEDDRFLRGEDRTGWLVVEVPGGD